MLNVDCYVLISCTPVYESYFMLKKNKLFALRAMTDLQQFIAGDASAAPKTSLVEQLLRQAAQSLEPNLKEKIFGNTGVGWSTCGRVFKKGDVIFHCRDCASDLTCVLCEDCFKNGNHEGHNVKYYLSFGSGGCCDCGDDEVCGCGGVCECGQSNQWNNT